MQKIEKEDILRENLKDYFSSGKWKEFLKKISDLLDLSFCNFVITYDEKIQSFSNENPLCLKLREKSEGLKLCKEKYEKDLKAVQNKIKPHLSYCYASLLRAIIPIDINNKKFFIVMCGIKSKNKPNVNWKKIGNIIGKKEFLRYYKKISYNPIRKVKTTIEAIQFLFTHIFELFIVNEKLKSLLEK